ncbi:unnamed protein product, partial [Prunus brigantina]
NFLSSPSVSPLSPDALPSANLHASIATTTVHLSPCRRCQKGPARFSPQTRSPPAASHQPSSWKCRKTGGV